MYPRPKYTDVLKAKKRIAPYLNKTPLLEHPGLSKVLGFKAYVKHENMQPTGPSRSGAVSTSYPS